MRRAIALKYHHQDISEDQLLAALQQAGIQAARPKPHECKEEQK